MWIFKCLYEIYLHLDIYHFLKILKILIIWKQLLGNKNY